jgi:hypothetical protein
MSNLPVGNPETFLGENEEMDLTPLHGKLFGVGVSNGPRDGTKFVSSTLLAPLDFYEMVEAVGNIYQKYMIHAKVFFLNKDPNAKMKYLDECTVDFIEARNGDIIMDALLSGDLSEGKEYTCRAGFFEAEDEVQEG